MIRLSIVIPALDNFAELETTLVSVLSHRPVDSEVIVVLSKPYSDPYQIGDEVRFITARRRAGWAECANIGMRESLAPIVNVISAGVEVAEDWTAAALRHFSDRRVGAVAPVILDAADADRVIASGVQYFATGKPVLGNHGATVHEAARSRTITLGPTRWSAFYRRDAICDILGGFDRSVGDECAEVDLALRMQYVGFQCVAEPLSRATVRDCTRRGRYSVARQCAAERLYWRNRTPVQPGSAVSRHALSVAREAATSLLSLGLLGVIVGRLWGSLAAVTAGAHHRRMRALQSQAQTMLATIKLPQDGRRLRIDRAHAAQRMSTHARPAGGRRMAA